MPVEPAASPWVFGTPADWPDDDLVAVGADLEPGTLLAAYRSGLFPMPSSRSRTRGAASTMWFSPVERGVLPLDGLRVSRSLRRSARDFEVRVDTAFADVVAACGDPGRDQGWIDAGIRAAYLRLHELGWAHSVEAWQDDVLVGGLYGVAVGGLFAGESMFHRVRDASKVALVALVDLLVDGQGEGEDEGEDEHAGARLLDVQWQTPHLESLGVVEVDRTTYLALLAAALTVPLPAVWR